MFHAAGPAGAGGDCLPPRESYHRQLLETVVLPKARESFETSLAGYGAGTVDIVGLLDARRALQAATLAVADAQMDREIALAELERAVGAMP